MHDTVTLSAAASKAAAAAAEAAGGEPVKRDAKMETFYLKAQEAGAGDEGTT